MIHRRASRRQTRTPTGGAKVIDLMAVLRKSLSKKAVVTTFRARRSRWRRRARRAKADAEEDPARRRAKPRQSAPRKRARRA